MREAERAGTASGRSLGMAVVGKRSDIFGCAGELHDSPERRTAGFGIV